MKRKSLDSKLKYWQEILRIQDWDIVIEKIKKRNKKAGDFEIDRDTKSAIVKIDFKNKKEDYERTLVHELLHIKLIDLDEMIEKTLYELFPKCKKEKGFSVAYNEFLKNLETTVEDLTKGYMDLSGKKIKKNEIKNLIRRRLK